MDRFGTMKAFVMAATAGSFSAAARRLGLSPQAVSKLIGQLEEDLGVQLLVRTTRSMHLTDAGSLYLTEAQGILDRVMELERDLRAQSTDPSGPLSISMPVSLGLRQLAPVLMRFGETYPAIDLKVALTDLPANLVEEGIDVGLRIGPIGSPSLMSRKITEGSMILCASPGFLERHPQLKGGTISAEDLAGLDAVGYMKRTGPVCWPILKSGQEANVKLRHEVDSADMACFLVEAGLGIGILPTFTIQNSLEAGKLVHIMPGFIERRFNISAVYPSGRAMAPKVRLLVDHLVAHFSSGAPWELALKRAQLSSAVIEPV